MKVIGVIGVICAAIILYMLLSSITAELQNIGREIKKLSEIIEDWSDT